LAGCQHGPYKNLWVVREDYLHKETLPVSHPYFERHQKTLDGAVAALKSRAYWSAYPEIPSGKIYGETAKADGQAAFEARLNKPFALDQPGTTGTVGRE